MKNTDVNDLDVLAQIIQNGYVSQREIAECSNLSLGRVNGAVNSLIEDRFITCDYHLSDISKTYIENHKPKNAIILAAGFGMRMVPINMETPKGLLEIHGERLIERLISQLHEVGIEEIYVVVGFMKECFEYLIDMYGVTLVVNSDYKESNNIVSLYKCVNYINNSYILPCDLYFEKNPFSDMELYSWYMVCEEPVDKSEVRVNRKREIVKSEDNIGNSMVGLSYITDDEVHRLKEQITLMCEATECRNFFWENALFDGKKMYLNAKLIDKKSFVEINTYEQLRDIDDTSSHLQTDAIDVICDIFSVESSQITNIEVIKKGMTNRSFKFKCKNKTYIMRIPGEGTSNLINRENEAAVYSAILQDGICDNVIYINPNNGYKITEYIEDVRVCNPFDEADITLCMRTLKAFHAKEFVVPHRFDIFEMIEFYEKLWNGSNSAYRDYLETKDHVLSLKTYVEKNKTEEVLTHIDAVPDNFLFINGKENPLLIDWEYAGMQDPHIDLAMFSIYAFYNKEQIDHLIDLYFKNNCEQRIRIKIYCYVSICGLLWSNWCEYKRQLGVEFGEYSLKQYRYAKEFYSIASELI